MAGTIQVTLNPNSFTSLGSGPMLIRTPATIGIAASGSGTPLATAAFTALAPNDTPFSVPQAEVFYGIALVPIIQGQPGPTVSVSVTT